MHALCPTVEIGNERETFFNSQMSVAHEVKFPQKGDFLVNDRYLFEVGGKNKMEIEFADEADLKRIITKLLDSEDDK